MGPVACYRLAPFLSRLPCRFDDTTLFFFFFFVNMLPLALPLSWFLGFSGVFHTTWCPFFFVCYVG